MILLAEAEIPFERELAAYNARKEELLKAEGQYVVIHDETIIGPYSSYTDAYKEGAKTFGTVRMLIKQVLREEPVTYSPSFSVARAKNVESAFKCHFSM